MWNRWLESDADDLKAVPLYLAVYGAYAMGASALYYEGGTGPAQALALLFVAAGLAFGFWLRPTPERRWIGMIIGGLLTAVAIVGTPLGVLQQSEIGIHLAFELVWLTLFLSFGACTDDTVLFLTVPSLAMLIASESEGADPPITAFALGFCLMGVFALVCHASLRDLRTGNRRGQLRRAAGSAVTLSQSLLNQWTLAAFLFIVTGFLAAFVIVPLRFMGDQFRPIILGTSRPLWRRRMEAQTVKPTAAGAFQFGQVKVGQGPVRPSDTPLLRVYSPRRLLRLSRVYTAYDSTGWEQGGTVWTGTDTSNGYLIAPDVYSRRWPVVSESIELLASSNVGPAAARLDRVDFPVWQGSPLIDLNQCIVFQAVAPAHFRYITWSSVPPDINHLGAAVSGGRAPEPPELPHVTTEVQDLAQRLQGHDAVDTTRRIVNYLQSHCTYDLNAPAVPTGQDAVDFFLFKSRAGYCDLFATSAALLLQLDDFSARYCVGYAPGRWDPQTNSQVITDAQAHAWIEVFVPGQGWIPVDPTPPGFSGPPSTGVKIRALMNEAQLHLPTISASEVLLLLVLIAIAYLAYSLSPTAAARRARARMGAAGQPGPYMDYWHLQRLLSQAGLPRRPDETPNEYRQRLSDARLPAAVIQPASKITERFVEARYGVVKRDEDPGPLNALRQALRRPEIRKALRAQSGRRTAAGREVHAPNI